MSDRLMGKSAYEILGVPAQASTAELKKAYRRQMRQSHPDLGGDPQVFAAVQEAWAQVGTATARAAYDRRRRSPAAPEPDPRVWATGASARAGTTRSAGGRARAHGHPGGWSRQRYLTLIREWVGRGVDLPDPYERALVARAPRELRHLLADAVAEEATAKALTSLGSAFTVWHDVATSRGSKGAGAGGAGATKIDHVVLGPTGLFAIQSEDWDAPVSVGGRDLHSSGLAPKERPFKDLAGRLKSARSWGLRFTALVIVLPDEHLEADVTAVGRSRRLGRLVVRRSAIVEMLRTGAPGLPGLGADALFDARTHLQRAITFV